MLASTNRRFLTFYIISVLVNSSRFIFTQDKLEPSHKEALQYISMVGCLISILFCILAVVGLGLAKYVTEISFHCIRVG